MSDLGNEEAGAGGQGAEPGAEVAVAHSSARERVGGVQHLNKQQAVKSQTVSLYKRREAATSASEEPASKGKGEEPASEADASPLLDNCMLRCSSSDSRFPPSWLATMLRRISCSARCMSLNPAPRKEMARSCAAGAASLHTMCSLKRSPKWSRKSRATSSASRTGGRPPAASRGDVAIDNAK